MKRLAFLMLFLTSFSSLAETVSFNLDHVPVMELAKLVYAEVSKSNFVIDSSILDLKDNVSVHFNDLERVQAVSVLETLLKSRGVEIDKTGTVIFLRAAREGVEIEPEDEIFFYRPKYRSTSYIVDLCGALFKDGKFSFQRKVSNPVPVPVAGMNSGAEPAQTNSTIPQSLPKKPVDTGTSAYSQLNKDVDAFFFTGSVSDIDKLKKLLVQVDTAVSQVIVKGMVYEVTTDSREGSAFGLAMTLLQGKFGLTIGNNTTIGDSISFKNASIEAVFSALNSDSRFKSVSNPSLRVQSGSNARFSVGSDVPVLGAVQMDRNGNPVQSVEYKPSGVIFDLRPEIRDSSIDLTISQQLSSFIPTTTGVNNSPTLIKREISTSIVSENNDVIVLGGLDEEKNSTDSSGLSFLPAFMKSSGGQSTKTQILLVLQVQKI